MIFNSKLGKKINSNLKQGDYKIRWPHICKVPSLKDLWNGLLVFAGFWLSPLSPWNDLFTNIPIAYAVGLSFSFVSNSLFLPGIIFGYWMSNIIGLLLMHYGYVSLTAKKYSLQKNWKGYLLSTLLYTAVVVALIQFEILPSAGDLIAQFGVHSI